MIGEGFVLDPSDLVVTSARPGQDAESVGHVEGGQIGERS